MFWYFRARKKLPLRNVQGCFLFIALHRSLMTMLNIISFQIFTEIKQPRWRRCRFKEKGSSTIWADSARSQLLWASCYKCMFAIRSVVLRFLIIFHLLCLTQHFDMMFSMLFISALSFLGQRLKIWNTIASLEPVSRHSIRRSCPPYQVFWSAPQRILFRSKPSEFWCNFILLSKW